MQAIGLRGQDIYTLKQGNKSVGFFSQTTNRPFVIGFKKLTHVRSVQYSIHPDPKFKLMLSDDVLKKEDLVVHFASTLFIPKCDDGLSTLRPMNDSGLHMQPVQSYEFYGMPYKGIGIAVAYELLDEDKHEYVFKTHVVSNSIVEPI